MIEKIEEKFKNDLASVSSLEELEVLRIKYLGRKGEATRFFIGLKNLTPAERSRVGQAANKLRQKIETQLSQRKQEFKDRAAVSSQRLDVTAPGVRLRQGHLHPRTQALRQAIGIFRSLGFSALEGPEIEVDWYNFEALNFPKDHPARDMQDTFYVKSSVGKEDLVARTHTSPMQVRYMEKNNPPLRIIVPGRVYRREATDASHDYQFYQVEGLMVDKEISVANFKAVMEEFFKQLYKKKIEIRLRPSFFPFTEPSFEVDISCVFCNQEGCRVCGQGGWLEVAGAGMVNQSVFKNAGYARNEWQGFAFGIGFERIVMMKYHINDIRLMSGGDMRFLKQF